MSGGYEQKKIYEQIFDTIDYDFRCEKIKQESIVGEKIFFPDF